jgi:hypothetical protein
MKDLRETILNAALEQARGQAAVHKTNIEVYLNNPAGIGEHSDVVEAVVDELNKLAEADDRIEMIGKYFL